jgi:RNA polymerase sigma-70 factor, ECF subfamily
MQDDVALARAAAAGDRTALGAFVGETHAHVWRYCVHLGGHDDAEDLVQETYARALRSLNQFDGRAPLRVWLLSIARRVCADAVRAARRRRALASLLTTRHTAYEEDRADERAIAALVAGLRPQQREAFVLTQIVGFSYEEAAGASGIPIGTIRSRVARAREHLLRCLDEAAGA